MYYTGLVAYGPDAYGKIKFNPTDSTSYMPVIMRIEEAMAGKYMNQIGDTVQRCFLGIRPIESVMASIVSCPLHSEVVQNKCIVYL